MPGAGLSRTLAQDMLNERLDRISREPDSAFQYAGLNSGELGIGGVSLASLYIQLAEDKASTRV